MRALVEVLAPYKGRKDRHADLKPDYLLANPPFNDSDWRGELLKDDKRWVHGTPPAGNANYTWVQRMVRTAAGGQTSRARITHRLGAS